MKFLVALALTAVYCQCEEPKIITKDDIARHAIDMSIGLGLDANDAAREVANKASAVFYGTAYLDENIEKSYLKIRIAERFRVAGHYGLVLPLILARAKEKYLNDIESASLLDLIVMDRIFTSIDRLILEQSRGSAQQGDAPEPATNANPASPPPSAPAR